MKLLAMVTYKRATNASDLKQILELQQRNLFDRVSVEELHKEGFLTVSHSFELLKKMNAVCPHIIAKANDKVVGYTLCMHPKFSNEIEILKPMFQEIETIIPKIENYIIMGQVCVAKNYRGKGVFRKLYQNMGDFLKLEFDTIITEVDAKNDRSLKAHYAVGFKLLKSHSSWRQDWELISLQIK